MDSDTSRLSLKTSTCARAMVSGGAASGAGGQRRAKDEGGEAIGIE